MPLHYQATQAQAFGAWLAQVPKITPTVLALAAAHFNVNREENGRLIFDDGSSILKPQCEPAEGGAPKGGKNV